MDECDSPTRNQVLSSAHTGILPSVTRPTSAFRVRAGNEATLLQTNGFMWLYIVYLVCYGMVSVSVLVFLPGYVNRFLQLEP